MGQRRHAGMGCGGVLTPGKTAGDGGSEPSSELPLTYPRDALHIKPTTFSGISRRSHDKSPKRLVWRKAHSWLSTQVLCQLQTHAVNNCWGVVLMGILSHIYPVQTRLSGVSNLAHLKVSSHPSRLRCNS